MPTHAMHLSAKRTASARWARRALAPVALIAAITAQAQPAANEAAPQDDTAQLEAFQRAAPQLEAPQHETPQRELLNSERIEQRFGSYGIAVLESDGRYRVSNLYSVHDGARICRTFAVVLYPERVDALFAAEHEDIVAGGSIGAVFTGNGWTVTKRHLHFGELRSTAKVAALMGVAEAEPLAVHVYVLSVSKGARSIDYATITELHHPDYLSLEDLPRIYGAPPSQAPPLLRDVLAETEARMR